MTNILLVRCKTSGAQDTTEADFQTAAKHAGVALTLRTVATPPDIAPELTAKKIQSYDFIGVYGGDGSVLHAAKALSDSSKPLIIFPGGTANVLANHYVMPADIESIFMMIATGTYVVERADVADMNGEPFMLDMHMGFWTEAILTTPRSLKKKLGEVAYGIQALKQKTTAKPFAFRYSLNSKDPVDVDAYTVLIVNQGNHKLAGVPIFPNQFAPSMTQMALIKDVRMSRLCLWLFWRAVTGRYLTEIISVHRAKKITIHKAPKQALLDDGEHHLDTPTTIAGGTYHVRLAIPPKLIPQSKLEKSWLYITHWYHVMAQRARVLFLNAEPSLKYSHVAPNIYLGGKYPVSAYKLFNEWGVTGVISMRTSVSPPAPKSIALLNLPTRDWSPPSIADLQRGITFAQEQIAAGGAVYIHCRLGEGRGPSMAAACLIAQGYTAEEAIALLRRNRPFVRPNREQMKRLAELQEHLAQTATKA